MTVETGPDPDLGMESQSSLIDWCLTPTLAVFQLYCGVNKLPPLDNWISNGNAYIYKQTIKNRLTLHHWSNIMYLLQKGYQGPVVQNTG